jgi:hypothetical protein
MARTDDVKRVQQKYEMLSPLLNERTRRLWAATEAQGLGWGGISRVVEATGLSEPTIVRGLRELAAQRARGPALPPERIRRPGGGDKRLKAKDPTLVVDLDALVDPATRGDPESPLRWTCKSTRKLASELQSQGHQVSAQTVAELLKEQGYSLQGNRKNKEGRSHPDRNAQFEHINRVAKAFAKRGQPVISVDTKKKELVGDYKNGGKEWQPAGMPEQVQVHDFPDPCVGKAIPYGVYDINRNEGWVTVGVDHDTADFAVAAIHAWWQHMGARRYPDATDLLITADSGGSNAARSKNWKVALQQLADAIGVRISVSHFPPGTSKWNKIEHRMFCHISQNWRGRPLLTHDVVVDLIANTTTRTGLTIRAKLDKRSYPTGLSVTDEQLADLNLERGTFHGDWNYAVAPHV